MAKVAFWSCILFIIWLFRADMAYRRARSKALLLPGMWLAIQGSRPVAYWFGGGGGSEASPITTISFAAFLIISVIILVRRGIRWGALAGSNLAIFGLYGYFLLSVFWSDLPVESLKRIVKDFGCVLVALVLLTEKNPAEAIRIAYVRVSYILFPLSVVFIKWVPDIGRQSTRAGENMFTGVTTQKNTLGLTVFVFSLFLLWDLVVLFRERRDRIGAAKRVMRQIQIRIAILLIGLWLLVTCDSQTSLLCLVIGSALFWGTYRLLRMANGRAVLITCLTIAGISVTLDKSLGISDTVIRAMGRNPTLTGRTDIWKAVLEQQNSTLHGHGFCIFWDTKQGGAVIDQLMRINSAHNGYLETYVDGGIIGLGILIVLLLSAGRRIIKRLFLYRTEFFQIGLCFWVLAIIYNFSETSFLRLDVLWFSLLLVSLVSTARKSLSRNQRGILPDSKVQRASEVTAT